MVRILTEPKNALVKQYTKLVELDGVTLEFEPEALSRVAELAIKRDTGARGLRSIIEETMRDVMFDIPSQEDIERVIITKATVDQTEGPLIKKGNTKAAS